MLKWMIDYMFYSLIHSKSKTLQSLESPLHSKWFTLGNIFISYVTTPLYPLSQAPPFLTEQKWIYLGGLEGNPLIWIASIKHWLSHRHFSQSRLDGRKARRPWCGAGKLCYSYRMCLHPSVYLLSLTYGVACLHPVWILRHCISKDKTVQPNVVWHVGHLVSYV